jgi:hypothetical protein
LKLLHLQLTTKSARFSDEERKKLNFFIAVDEKAIFVVRFRIVKKYLMALNWERARKLNL